MVEVEGEGEEEEEEEDGGGLEGGEAVDGGVALEERVGVGGDDQGVDQGDEEGEGEEVELQVLHQAVPLPPRDYWERVVWLRHVLVRRSAIQVVPGGADKVVQPQRDQRRRRKHVVH